jgi:hypothetical protein
MSDRQPERLQALMIIDRQRARDPSPLTCFVREIPNRRSTYTKSALFILAPHK